MEIRKLQEQYLVFCKYRKELDDKTLKAYRIDLRQYFEWVKSEEPGKAEIEEYITKLHISFKQKTVKRKFVRICRRFLSFMMTFASYHIFPLCYVLKGVCYNTQTFNFYLQNSHFCLMKPACYLLYPFFQFPYKHTH